MERSFLTIKRKIKQEETVFDQMAKQLQTNPIKEQFSKFMTKHKKTTAIDIFRNT